MAVSRINFIITIIPIIKSKISHRLLYLQISFTYRFLYTAVLLIEKFKKIMPTWRTHSACSQSRRTSRLSRG